MALIYDGTSGITFNDGTQVGSASQMGIRNRIINGHMIIDQRNAGTNIVPTGNQYSVDRWVYATNTASKMNIKQNQGGVTPPAGFTNYLGANTATAYTVTSSDYFAFIQNIEGYNCFDLAWGTAGAKTCTLSFWVQSSLTGTFGGAINATSTPYTYPFTYTINSANTWQYVTILIPGLTSGTMNLTNGVGLQVWFGMGVGSTYSAAPGAWTSGNYLSATGGTSVVGTNGATFYITGVQFEKGSVATPFDFRLYGKELLMCQRYYAKSYAQGTVPGTASIYNGALQSYVGTGSSGASLPFRFPVSMRAVPTITFYDLAGTSGKVYANGNGVTPDAQTSYYGTDGAYFGQTSVTSGGVQLLAQYTASAEL